MKATFIVAAALCLCGCNLFRETPRGDAADGGPSDVGHVDMRLADAQNVADSALPDAQTPDEGRPSDTFDCLAETDEELCAARNATCGTLWNVTEDVAVKMAGPDIDNSTCAPVDGRAALCNTTAYVEIPFTVTTPGDYLALLFALDTSSSDVRAHVEISLDGNPLTRLLNDARFPDVGQLTYVLKDVPAGAHTVRWRMTADAYIASIDYDLNLEVESAAVLGPVVPFVDRCGASRDVDCGTCDAPTTCGQSRAWECSCPCPLDDGTCAPQGPHPTDTCSACTSDGWVGTNNACDDGDGCTENDRCDPRAGVCTGPQIACVRGQCEVGTCSGGACAFTPSPDGDACGATGVCQAGQCGCPGGPFVETICGGNTDDDCDGLLNCEDPDCDGLSCGGQRVCSGSVCQ